MSPTSSAEVLICRRSTARRVPSWTGISYCLPVRLSTTVMVSLGTRGILDFGWGKITTAGWGKTGNDGEAGDRSAPRLSPSSPVALSWLPHDPPRARQTRQSLPDPLGGGRLAGATAGGPRPHRVPVARHHARGSRDRGQRRQGDGSPVRRAGRRLHQARLEPRPDRGRRRVGPVRDGS